ncbi:putative stereocilin-like protein [Protopterus annectens]|uniref:putative stereocilin-like protein n=1 Tax=Protopterus annectens TaxID=7888 RepID=UPI001CFA9FD4|nr:putative stereocilin-like protein [Protopterus annectens]
MKKVQVKVKNLVKHLQVLGVLPKKGFLPFFGTNPLGRSRPSQFLYNISMQLQNYEGQGEEFWENFLSNLFQLEGREEKLPPAPVLKLKDFLISLRGSRNWDSLLSLIQKLLSLFSKDQSAVWLIRQNWELVVGVVETIFKALMSETYSQAVIAIQNIVCTLSGHSDCRFTVDQFQQLLKLFETRNWKPVINVQSGNSFHGHGRLRPLNMLSGTFKGNSSNLTRLSSGMSSHNVQSLLQILYRTNKRDSGIRELGSVQIYDDILWDGLAELRQGLLKTIRSSVYANVKKKVSRMTGSLVDEVSSVIGIPQADIDGRCSAGDLRQLLLWGIKNNVTWNVHSLGFNSHDVLMESPSLPCMQTSKDTMSGSQNSHKLAKRSEDTEENLLFGDVLEAACNDTIPGLPGVSNFTVFLYCNLFVSPSEPRQAVTDLQSTCSDAAWYLSAVEEDTLWVKVCSEYFPIEFNETVCGNTTFETVHGYGQPLISDLCSHLPHGTDAPSTSHSNCTELLHSANISQEDIWSCFLKNDSILIKSLCNATFRQTITGDVAWISAVCDRHDIGMDKKNRSVKKVLEACNYKVWSQRMLYNTSLVESCIGTEEESLVEHLCKNISSYQLLASYPWLVIYCARTPSNNSENAKCVLQMLVEMFPIPGDFDSSQLCRGPATYLLETVSQLKYCEHEPHNWIRSVNYILRALDFMLNLSSLEENGKEIKHVLSEAILLSSLSDNSSFWTYITPSSSVSILETIGTYLEHEQNMSFKKDFLNCFSPVLWDLLQNDDSPALRVLFQAFLN